jgi:nucleoside-diphosphate-sugar epimerase
MKILVTGATGFIGQHLVNALLAKGHAVKCLVRKTSNTESLRSLGVELSYGDLLDRSSLEKAMSGVSVIYHLAAEVYALKISEYNKKNIIGTKNLAEVSLRAGISKFVYLSSIGAVGQNTSRHILLNEKTPCNPTTPYGKSKLAAEKILLDAFSKYSLPVVIIRAPIIYGPGQPSVLSRFFTMIYNKTFKMVGDGNNLKSFCYIDNLVDGMMLAEKSVRSTGKIYFISDNKVYTPNEFAEAIASEEGVVLKKIHLPYIIASISGGLLVLLEKLFRIYSVAIYSVKTMAIDYACDIKKAQQELGYNPQIDLQEGIRRTVQWCKEQGLLKTSI